MSQTKTVIDEENQKGLEHVNSFIVEKYLFFIGFIIPIAWFVGSSFHKNETSTINIVWKKRCKIASTVSLILFIVFAAIIMVVNPKLVGIKSDSNASSAQTSSDTNNAIRPGVPLVGSNDYGDTVAGIDINV